jgi:hypothetical protein
MADDASGYAGQAGLTAGNSSRNADDFQAQQRTAHVRTMVPVKVMKVHGGGVGPAPTLDVQILLDQQDGQGNATPHGMIYGIQAPRNMSGNMAIINDPVVGDMGWMHVADRDISAFVSANDKASPGSNRRHSMSDGVYQRSHDSKGTPKQYIMAREDGITIVDVNKNKLESGKNGWTITGDLMVSGNVTAGFGGNDSVSMQNHTHPTAPVGPPSKPTAGS